MYEISVSSVFSGAHYLAGYDGPCGKVHGHNWEVRVFLRGSELDDMGMLADFSKVKLALKNVLNDLDHEDLNHITALSGVNPTSENIATYLYRELARLLDCPEYSVSKVSVSETAGSSASYWSE